MRNIAVIPARGGSKRLPRKNVLPFMGKPMFVWTVEAALSSQIFQRVIISTEDEEIASIADDYGFERHKRPENLAGDQATVAEVCLHLLEDLENHGDCYDALCCLYATAPLRTNQDIHAVMSLLGDDVKNMSDFSIAVTDYSHSPYQMLIHDPHEFLIPAWPIVVNKKSQEVPKSYAGNGSTYAARIPAFKEYRDFYGPRMRGYNMPRMRSFDIDTEADLEMALWAAQWHENTRKKQ